MGTERPLRVLLWDATGHGTAPVQPLLTASWGVGGALYRGARRFDAARGVGSWAEALDWLAWVEGPIGEIQYWGHGRPGRVLVAGDALDGNALVGVHAARVAAVKARLAGPEALVWLRTCSAFAGEAGHTFARACVRAFGCRAAGHTFVIGPLQSGLHSLAPGAAPSWSPEEGLATGNVSLPSAWGRPNTITCLRDTLPEGW